MEIRERSLEQGALLVNGDFASLLQKHGLLSSRALWNIKDEPVKAVVPERRTGRFFLNGAGGERIEFYIKKYRPVPLTARFKAFFSLKFKDKDALHEWRALLLFHKNLLPTLIPVAAGKTEEGTFCVTLGLKNYKRASELLDRDSGLGIKDRLALIERVAIYAARMHKLGFAHQDLYLLHFFIKFPEKTTFLIDLQRVVIQERLRRRWVIKDLAQLLFSSRLVMSDEEIDHLWDAYCAEVGFDIRDDKRLFKDIEKKAAWMMKRHLRKGC